MTQDKHEHTLTDQPREKPINPIEKVTSPQINGTALAQLPTNHEGRTNATRGSDKHNLNAREPLQRTTRNENATARANVRDMWQTAMGVSDRNLLIADIAECPIADAAPPTQERDNSQSFAQTKCCRNIIRYPALSENAAMSAEREGYVANSTEGPQTDTLDRRRRSLPSRDIALPTHEHNNSQKLRHTDHCQSKPLCAPLLQSKRRHASTDQPHEELTNLIKKVTYPPSFEVALTVWQNQNHLTKTEIAPAHHHPISLPNTQSQPTDHEHEPNTHNHDSTLKSTALVMAHPFFFRTTLILWQNQNHQSKLIIAKTHFQPTLLPNTQPQSTDHVRELNTYNHDPNLKSTTLEMAHLSFFRIALISWQTQITHKKVRPHCPTTNQLYRPAHRYREPRTHCTTPPIPKSQVQTCLLMKIPQG